ncbi:MAG: alpha-E domain-containing protein [Opitutales bacterium]
MLSRVADSFFWMSRYIERAENIARLVDVNIQIQMDFEDLNDDKLKEHWQPIIETSGDASLFHELYDVANSHTVSEFFTFNRKNPSSIVSVLFAARENARMIRDQLSSELWETVNEMYLFLKGADARRVWNSGAYEFYKKIQNNSHLFQGLAAATFPYGEGQEFINLGRFLERGSNTCRILDTKYHILLPSVSDVGGAVDAVQWTAVLRSCSAYEAYHRLYVSNVEPARIARFLILDETFPRSILFSLRFLNQALHNISGSSHVQFSNEAERLCGRMMSDLSYRTVEDIFAQGLHEFLVELQERMASLGQAIFEAYMFQPPLDMAAEIATQQQQQQQQ